MSETELLDHIRVGLLKDLARALATGTATHQEKAIAKSLLRDNKSVVEDPPREEDDHEQYDDQVPQRPQRKPRVFGDSKG